MALDTEKNGLPPTPFWTTKGTFFDEKKFRKEIQALPSFQTMSTAFLTLFVYKLGEDQSSFCKDTYKLGTSPIELYWQGVKDSWYKEFRKRTRFLSINESCTAFCGLSLFQKTLDPDFLWAFRKMLKDNHQTLSNDDLDLVFVGAGKSSTVIPDLVIDQGTLRLPEFTPAQRVNFICGVGRSGKRLSTPSLERFVSCMDKEIPDLSDKEIAYTLWPLAIFATKEPLPQKAMTFAERLVHEAKSRSEMDPELQHACRHACLCLFPEEAGSFVYNHAKEETSKLEEDFKTALRNAHYALKDSLRHIPSLATSVDTAWICGGKKVLVEVDGFRHFLDFRRKGIFNGPTQFMTALLVDACPEAIILRVPGPSASWLATEGNPFLWTMKSIIAELEPGAYRLDIRKEGPVLRPIENRIPKQSGATQESKPQEYDVPVRPNTEGSPFQNASHNTRGIKGSVFQL